MVAVTVRIVADTALRILKFTLMSYFFRNSFRHHVLELIEREAVRNGAERLSHIDFQKNIKKESRE